MIRMVDKLYVFALLCAWPGLVFCQTDTLNLKEVEIVAVSMKNDLPATHLQKIYPNESPLASSHSLSNLLSNRTNLTLRGYGPGSSFGVSIRGGSSSQTQVLLNGVPFENPGLATSDVSLLASGIANEIAIYRGSASAYLGNAAVGGSILLSTAPPRPDNTVKQSFTAGSFGSFGSFTHAAYGNTRFSGTTALFFQRADNDFSRPDPFNETSLQPQPNAAFTSRGLTQDLCFYTRGNTSVHTFFLASETDRQLPPTLFRNDSKTTQTDRSFRAQAIVSSRIKSVDLKFNTALDHGFLNYTDPNAGLDENSDYTAIHIRGEARHNIGKTKLFAFAILHQAYVLTENYRQREQRFSPAIVAGANRNFFNGNTRVSALLRQEFLNGRTLPLMPVVSVSQKVLKGLDFDFSAGRTYRLPGLNDLFWQPGGNPNLKPESGWYQEAGFNYSSSDDLVTEAGVTAFHRTICNWIQWVPGSDYWSPRNIRVVESTGVDARLSIAHQTGVWSFRHAFSGTLARSVSKEPLFEGDKSVGKQLIYIPRWSLHFSEEAGLLENKIAVNLTGRFFSERFTTADNSRSLDAYFVLDAEVSSHFDLWQSRLAVFVAVHNVLDHAYRLEAAYPMPGINYQAGLKIHLNLKQNKS